MKEISDSNLPDGTIPHTIASSALSTLLTTEPARELWQLLSAEPSPAVRIIVSNGSLHIQGYATGRSEPTFNCKLSELSGTNSDIASCILIGQMLSCLRLWRGYRNQPLVYWPLEAVFVSTKPSPG